MPALRDRQADDIENAIGYRFKSRRLMHEALTHSSATRRGHRAPRTNERLEFLGDRVLGLTVAELLMRRYPDDP
jgi:ribonuclease III